MTVRLLLFSTVLLAALAGAPEKGYATDTLNCNIELLEDLGWQTGSVPAAADILNPDTCQHNLTPYLNLGNLKSGRSTAGLNTDTSHLLHRVNKAIQSDTSKCLFNSKLRESVIEATGKIISNTGFVFPKPGQDPRDPFTPPESNWLPSPRHGYDIPSHSLTDGIQSLYQKPVIAECAAAIQIAQLATLVEHFHDEANYIVAPEKIGIGVWSEFAKSPSIKANTPLLISRKQRKHALKRLATLGRGAFYNQSGYLRPVNDTPEFIDSLDNRGQNFLIVDISEKAVTDLKNRRRPLPELNKVMLKIWHNHNRLRLTGLSMDILEELLEKKLLATDSFFSDVTVYIHPLRMGTFAKFLARQFRYNPRTAYRFEVYEDFQAGYFFNSYVKYRLSKCEAR